MKSMTGFGRGEYEDREVEIIVEMKSVNYRYKDFFIKAPRQLTMFEEKIRKEISNVISRGRVEVYICIKKNLLNEKSLMVDKSIAQQYTSVLRELKADYKLSGEISIDLVAKYPDIITSEESAVDYEQMWNKLLPALSTALEGIAESRKREGETIKNEFNKGLENIRISLDKIRVYSLKVVEEYQARLKDKMIEYTSMIDIDESLVLQEVAIFADKVNIDEEITRLKSHVDGFNQIIDKDEPIGRKLDFLLQEMNREVNTIGSKANHLDISNLVVEMKSELEKIREQVQNIE